MREISGETIKAGPFPVFRSAQVMAWAMRVLPNPVGKAATVREPEVLNTLKIASRCCSLNPSEFGTLRTLISRVWRALLSSSK